MTNTHTAPGKAPVTQPGVHRPGRPATGGGIPAAEAPASLVRWVQQALNKHLKQPLPVTGTMNAATARAIQLAQRQLQLPPDGRITPLLVQRLRRQQQAPSPAAGKPATPARSSRTQGPRKPRNHTAPVQVQPPRRSYIAPTSLPRQNMGRQVQQQSAPGSLPSPGTVTTSSFYKPVHRPRRKCTACGCSHGDCTLLQGFALNSAQLTAQHRAQLQTLVQTIIQRGFNGVVVTGYTDASGTEAYNRELGESRATNVMGELFNQLKALRPGQQNKLFFRINTKGESRPLPGDDAANRRVSVCLKQLVVSRGAGPLQA